jgi:hypothetical protein
VNPANFRFQTVALAWMLLHILGQIDNQTPDQGIFTQINLALALVSINTGSTNIMLKYILSYYISTHPMWGNFVLLLTTMN